MYLIIFWKDIVILRKIVELYNSLFKLLLELDCYLGKECMIMFLKIQRAFNNQHIYTVVMINYWRAHYNLLLTHYIIPIILMCI